MTKANVIDDFQGLQAIRSHLKATLPTYVAEATLTSAEILALHTTGKTLVAAPGAGLIVVPVGLYLALDYNSAAYAAIGTGDDLQLRYTDVSGAVLATVEATGFLDATADAKRIVTPSLQAAVAPVENAAVVLALSGAVTTGDSPIDARLYYNLIPTAFGL